MDNLIPNINYEDVKGDLIVATGVDTEHDDKLQVAYRLASEYAYGLLADKNTNPTILEAVLKTSLKEMTILRFNRLEEEGMKQRTQDGESITWSDSLYAPFDDKIKSAIINNGSGWNVVVLGTREAKSREFVMYIPVFNEHWYWQSSEYFTD